MNDIERVVECNRMIRRANLMRERRRNEYYESVGTLGAIFVPQIPAPSKQEEEIWMTIDRQCSHLPNRK